MNGETRLLDYLKKHKSITVKEASEKLGNLRLSSTIYYLRHDKGYNIITKMEEALNRYGERTRFGRYILIDTTSKERRK